MTQTFFKILRDGKSCCGGNWTRDMPTANPDGTYTPGAWQEDNRGPSCIGRVGFHLTDAPEKWWLPGRQVYVAAVDANTPIQLFEDLCAVSKCRLLRPATSADLESTGLRFIGEHELTSDRAYVLAGTAAGIARGNSSVKLYEQAQVHLYDFARACAKGQA